MWDTAKELVFDIPLCSAYICKTRNDITSFRFNEIRSGNFPYKSIILHSVRVEPLITDLSYAHVIALQVRLLFRSHIAVHEFNWIAQGIIWDFTATKVKFRINSFFGFCGLWKCVGIEDNIIIKVNVSIHLKSNPVIHGAKYRQLNFNDDLLPKTDRKCNAIVSASSSLIVIIISGSGTTNNNPK